MPSDLATPRVSVLLPSYNMAGKIARCIDSVLAQSLADLELVISDDASTDRSRDVIETYDDPRIVYQAQPRNLGMLPNWRACLAMSRAPYFVLVGGDDYLRPTMLERCVAVLDSDTEIAFCHTAAEFFTDAGRTSVTGVFTRDYVKPGRDLVRDFVYGKRVVNTSSVVRRSCFDSVGGWSDRYRNSMDVDLWFRLMFRWKVGYLGEILTGFRSHGVSDAWTQLVAEEHVALVDEWLEHAPPEAGFDDAERAMARAAVRWELLDVLESLPQTPERCAARQQLLRDPVVKSRVRPLGRHRPLSRVAQRVTSRLKLALSYLPPSALHQIGDLEAALRRFRQPSPRAN